MAGDLDSLVDMGFDREKAQMALKQSGNLTSAIDWLDKNSDKDISQLRDEDAADTEANGPALQAGETAKSMVCNECQKKFRSMAQAQFHAEKSGHTDFAESTEELAPLTEEEKKARLAELKAKLAEKRGKESEQDKADRKRNEEIRKKSTKEQSDAKEELQRKEQMKEAAKKRQEKNADIAAKKRIQAKIAADKEDRRKKAEQEKAQRANPGLADPQTANAVAAATPAAAAAPARPTANHSEARLRLQTAGGNVMKIFPADTTLFEVAHSLAQESSIEVSSFTQNFPKKVFDTSDFGQTLKEAGLVPSAALIVK